MQCQAVNASFTAASHQHGAGGHVGAIQRVLDISSGKDKGYFSSSAELPKLALPAKASEKLRRAMQARIQRWADANEKDGVKSFKNWVEALKAARQEAEEELASIDEKTVAPSEDKASSSTAIDERDLREEEADSLSDEEEDEPIALKIPLSTQELSKTRELFFTEEGHFANEDGRKMSASAVNGLLGSLKLKHIYAGHGPALTDDTLRSSAMTQGVSGKWLTDFDAMMAVAMAYSQIVAKAITPGEHFKIMHIGPMANSLNYRYREVRGEMVLVNVPASKAKVGFKKQSLGKGKGDYYSLKTVFPYPEKVDADGNPRGY
ncbi:hypothetical protein DBR42_07080 [Pelomonas sp. HMWF004]|nr:hypothetical protein DBR42_07080 [Pelomonas sp. HMWF004]